MLQAPSDGVHMKVGSICKKDAVSVRPSDELVAAARLMREKHIGYLVVTEPDLRDGAERPVGVLTDRDIVVSVVAREVDPRSLRVADVMTPEPLLVSDHESTAWALLQMRRIGVRRLPVVGTYGQLVGVLSLDDVLDVLADELQDVAGSIRNGRRLEGVLRP
jgi:CBS domain-containing protein